ncbi:MAG: hypothetical protein IH957_12355 [Chloroflexi bacterium]|nr:hypothetical protein [Chloroflexota bacterium]
MEGTARRIASKGVAVLIAAAILLLTFAVEEPASQGKFANPNGLSGANQELAFKYRPVILQHPDDCFPPMTVEDFLADSDLIENKTPDEDQLVNDWDGTGEFLRDSTGPEHYLDLPLDHRSGGGVYCSRFESAIPDSEPRVYARVTEDEGQVVVQYWLFYYFNDAFPDEFDHEGDWEVVQVVFPPGATVEQLADDQSSVRPTWVAYSQHEVVQARRYADGVLKDGLRPTVSVALGSHANSYAPAACDRTGFLRIFVDERLPWDDSVPVDYTLEMIETFAWHEFAGNWGQISHGIGQGGPGSLVLRDPQWLGPVTWTGSDESLCPGLNSWPVVSLSRGDNDCDGDTDSVDALKVLQDIAAIPFNQQPDCPQIGSVFVYLFGDVDCDKDVDSVDGLKILQSVAAIPFSQNEPCPDIGEPL